jgi:hypothetical protein
MNLSSTLPRGDRDRQGATASKALAGPRLRSFADEHHREVWWQAGQAAAAVGAAASSVPSTSGGFGKGAFHAAIRLGMEANRTKMK